MEKGEELKSGFWDREVFVKDVPYTQTSVMRVCITTKGKSTFIVWREFYWTAEESDKLLAGREGGKVKISAGAEFAAAIAEAFSESAILLMGKAS